MDISNRQHKGPCPNCGEEPDQTIVVGDGEKSPNWIIGDGFEGDFRVWACQHNGATFLHREVDVDYLGVEE